MLLVIDAGNSHVTVGLARDGDLIASRRAASRASATPDELEVLLEGLLRLDGQGLVGAAAVAIASTVPALTDAFEAIAARREIPCAVASAGTIPMAVHVDRPGDVGPDRLVNAYAAAHLVGTPVIVVDCGTATTFDAVDSQGAFVGGAIAPPTNAPCESTASNVVAVPQSTTITGVPTRWAAAYALTSRSGPTSPGRSTWTAIGIVPADATAHGISRRAAIASKASVSAGTVLAMATAAAPTRPWPSSRSRPSSRTSSSSGVALARLAARREAIRSPSRARPTVTWELPASITRSMCR